MSFTDGSLKKGRVLVNMSFKEWVLTRYALRAVSHRLRYFLNSFLMHWRFFLKNSAIYPGVKFFGIDKMRFGKYIVIRDNCHLQVYGQGSIKIGNDVFIGMFCIIDGTGGVVIGNGVAISYHTCIVSASHKYGDLSAPSGEQGFTAKGVSIGDNAWIGAHVSILDGASIGEGAVIGAGSVVTGDIPKFAVAAGVPARVIKYRK